VLGAGLFLCAGPAWAQGSAAGDEGLIAFLTNPYGIGLLIVGALLLMVVTRSRRHFESDSDRNAAERLLALEREAAKISPARPVDPADGPRWREFLLEIDEAERPRLVEAAAALRDRGQAFDGLYRAAEGGTFGISGRRIDAGFLEGVGLESGQLGRPAVDRVWVVDVSRITRERDDALEMIDNAPVALWRRDAAGAVTLSNAGAAPLLPDIERFAEMAQRARNTGHPATESSNRVIDGSRRLFEITERPAADDGTVGSAVDMTAIEDLQSQLAKHIDAHGEVLEALGTAIAIFGPDRRLTLANRALLELWRLPDDVVHRNPSLGELLDLAREHRRLPEQADFRAWREDFQRLFNSLVNPYEDLLFLPDGSTLRMRVIPHAFGGLLVTLEDVTDRLVLERSINTLSEVQRETLDNLFEGIAVFGADGRLQLSNPAFRAQWGIAEQEDGEGEEGLHLRQVLDRMRERYPRDVEWAREAEAWRERLDDRLSKSGRIEQEGGRILDFSVVPLPDGATLLNFRDVTDTLAVQHALQERTEALEMADRLKSEFLANVSYELRTPLNAITGFSEILVNQYAGPLSERQQEYASAILESSAHLVGLVNNILDLASIEAGYLELDLGATSLDRVLSSIETLSRERARTRNIDFSIDAPEDLPVIEADERRLTQAVYNMVSNAFAFTANGGSVVLRVVTEERDQPGSTESGLDIIFQVRDSGIGVALENISSVASRFERGGRQARAAVSLSLVKALIELHDGQVEMQSDPRLGNTVTCRVPVRPVPTDPPAGPELGADA